MCQVCLIYHWRWFLLIVTRVLVKDLILWTVHTMAIVGNAQCIPLFFQLKLAKMNPLFHYHYIHLTAYQRALLYNWLSQLLWPDYNRSTLWNKWDLKPKFMFHHSSWVWCFFTYSNMSMSRHLHWSVPFFIYALYCLLWKIKITQMYTVMYA